MRFVCEYKNFGKEALLSGSWSKRSQIQREFQFPGRPRPTEGALFFMLGEEKLLFHEATQKIYTLNDLAAFIWCLLEERRSPPEICETLMTNGVGGDVAREHTYAAIQRWLQIGVLRLEYPIGDSGTFSHSLRVEIADFSVKMEVETKPLVESLTLAFGHVSPGAEFSDCVLQILEIDGMACVFRDAANVMCCPVSELACQLKAYVTQQILDRRAADVAFHSATLVRGGRALLISGPPGAGKSTLVARLLEEDFEYAGDDVALVRHDGEVRALPFPITLKSGSWELVSRFRPELGGLPIYDRPDSMKLRFLRPEKMALPTTFPVAWIIFIRRTARGNATSAPLSKSESMRKLIESSYSSRGQLTLESCLALRQTITGAKSFDLTYSDLESAKNAILTICDV
jgi:hypothetical protein